MKHLPEIITTIATILAILGCALPAWDLNDTLSSNSGLWESCGLVPLVGHKCVSIPTDAKSASLVATEIFSILTILALATSTLLFLTKHKFSRVTALFGALFALITVIIYASATRQDIHLPGGTLGPAFYVEIAATLVALIAVFVHGKVGKKRRR